MKSADNMFYDSETSIYHVRVYRDGRFHHIGAFPTQAQAQQTFDDYNSKKVSMDKIARDPQAWYNFSRENRRKILEKYANDVPRGKK